jgi:hypothetical protein
MSVGLTNHERRPCTTVELIGLSGSMGKVLLQHAEPCEGLLRLRFAGARCFGCLLQDIVLYWGEAELTDARMVSMLTTSLVAPTVTVIVRKDLRLLRRGWVGWCDEVRARGPPPLVDSSDTDVGSILGRRALVDSSDTDD